MADPGCQIYLITPATLPDLAGFADTLSHVLDAGPVACMQLRLKDASDNEICQAAEALRPIAHARDVAFLLNDRPDLAVQTGCDGVHIGQSDTSLPEARRIMGAGGSIGVTCHDSRHLAMEAADGGADYVAFGAFFPTVTKDTHYTPEPTILSDWTEMTTVPCVAIGGISAENCAPLVQAGADFLALSGAIWNHSEGAANGIKLLSNAIEQARE